MDFTTNRRRFLQLTGTGAAFSLAGCNSLQNPQQQETTTASEGTGDATVTLALEIDQEVLQEEQVELQQQMQNGTINETEAQERLQNLQTELIGDAMSSFQEQVRDDSSLSIDDTAEELGIVLISGTPSALIGTLSNEEARGLFPEATFEEAQAQSQSGGL
ncbi:MAG: hypothetical protein ACOCY7_01955 [Halodesulfurarchaeum sp.]